MSQIKHVLSIKHTRYFYEADIEFNDGLIRTYRKWIGRKISPWTDKNGNKLSYLQESFVDDKIAAFWLFKETSPNMKEIYRR